MIWETSSWKSFLLPKIVLTFHCLNKLFYWSQKCYKFSAFILVFQKFFSITLTIFSHSRSEQFWLQKSKATQRCFFLFNKTTNSLVSFFFDRIWKLWTWRVSKVSIIVKYRMKHRSCTGNKFLGPFSKTIKDIQGIFFSS